MRHTRVVAPLALVAILSGCYSDLFGPGTIGPPNDGGGYCYYPCADLGIQTTSSAQNILVGDSLAAYSYSTRLSNAGVDWSTKSPGVSFSYRPTTNGQVITGQTITGVPLYAQVFVKGTVVGKDTISVATTNPSYSATMSFVVADSASMTYLRILGSTTQVKVGNTMYLTVALKDSAGNDFRGTPTWTSSDPSVVSIVSQPTTYYSSSSANAHGVKAGTAKVIASFRNLSDTLLVTVTP